MNIANPIFFKRLLINVFFAHILVLAVAQDNNTAADLIPAKFAGVLNEKPLGISGGFNSAFGFYNVRGIESRREPFVYSLNANLNFKIYGLVDMSFGINYNSRNQLETSDPREYLKGMLDGILKKTGFSPKYKSVTLHIGDRSMNFSQYTYSGLRFYGQGIEYKPKNSLVGFSAFRGSLQRKQIPDTLLQSPVVPTYERMGAGVKVQIGNNKNNVDLIMFKAKDDVNSLPFLSPAYNVKPQENLVLGFETKHKIGKRIDFQFEYVSSAYTADLRAPGRESIADYTYYNNLGRLFKPLLSTRYNKALNTGIKYKAEKYGAGFSYKRVDPTFVTLGSSSAKNDFEALTADGNLALYQGKIMLMANAGAEQNNLANLQSLTMLRLIGGINASYTVTKDLTLSGNYANFNHSTEPSIINYADSIRMVQTNTNSGVNASYVFGKDNYKHNISANAIWQNTQDVQELSDIKTTTTNDVSNYLLAYNVNIKSLEVNGGLNYMYSLVKSPENLITANGPAITISKKLLEKKITVNFSTAYLSNTTDEVNLGNTLVYKLGGNYKPNPKHNVRADISLLDKKDKVNTDKSFIETQIKLAYSYTF